MLRTAPALHIAALVQLLHVSSAIRIAATYAHSTCTKARSLISHSCCICDVATAICRHCSVWSQSTAVNVITCGPCTSACMQAVADDVQAVLVFSGGYTRREAGARSEAGSYWQVAHALGWFGQPEVQDRALIEDRARDSLENLLFSVCRFRQFTGNYPAKVTIVSYSFKKERFETLHAVALGFPQDKVDFVGTPPLDPVPAQKVRTLHCFFSDGMLWRLAYGKCMPSRHRSARRAEIGVACRFNVKHAEALHTHGGDSATMIAHPNCQKRRCLSCPHRPAHHIVHSEVTEARPAAGGVCHSASVQARPVRLQGRAGP